MNKYGEDLSDSYIGTSVSGSLAAGTAVIDPASLIYDATYTVEVFGVTGYQNGSNTFKAGEDVSAGSTVVSVPLASLTNSSPVTAVSRNDRDDYGYIALGGSSDSIVSLEITFDKDIEVDPSTQYLAEISGITQSDIDEDTVINTLLAFTGDVTVDPPVASNHLTVTASDNVLTITTKAGYLATEDTADDLSITINFGSIYIRESGSTEEWYALSTGGVLPATMNSTTVIVRNSSAQE